MGVAVGAVRHFGDGFLVVGLADGDRGEVGVPGEVAGVGDEADGVVLEVFPGGFDQEAGGGPAQDAADGPEGPGDSL